MQSRQGATPLPCTSSHVVNKRILLNMLRAGLPVSGLTCDMQTNPVLAASALPAGQTRKVGEKGDL